LAKLCAFIAKTGGTYSHLYIRILNYLLDQSHFEKLTGSQL
jgi:hypothetical protein